MTMGPHKAKAHLLATLLALAASAGLPHPATASGIVPNVVAVQRMPIADLVGAGSGSTKRDVAGIHLLDNLGAYTSDGEGPLGALVADKHGALYGTTCWGGSSHHGTIYKLTPSLAGYSERILYAFHAGSDGECPRGGLIVDTQGALYGTTCWGGAYGFGTVFVFAPDSSGAYAERILHSFNGRDGYFPTGNLTFGERGTLYGTTMLGGESPSEQGFGTVFQLRPSGPDYRERVIHVFRPTVDNSMFPMGGLLLLDGKLYGTTAGDWESGGNVFELNAGDGRPEFRIIHTFGSNGTNDGRNPQGPLIADKRGALYGTTAGGGDFSRCWGSGCGTVYKLQPSQAGYAEIVLYRFHYDPPASPIAVADGADPVGGVISDDKGDLYGTTSWGGMLGQHGSKCIQYEGPTTGCGTIFKLTPTRSGYAEEIFPFHGSDGYFPSAGLTRVDGALFGTAGSGGTNAGGTVFQLVP